MHWTEEIEEYINKWTIEEIVRFYNEYKKLVAKLKEELKDYFYKYGNLEIGDLYKKLSTKEVKELKEQFEISGNEQLSLTASNLLQKERDKVQIKNSFNRLDEINIKIKKLLLELGVQQEVKLTELLIKLHKDNYSLIISKLGEQLGINITSTNYTEDEVRDIIMDKWLEDNYIGRIWKDKDKLMKKVEDEFLGGVARNIGGYSIETLIATKIIGNYNNYKKLVMTETSHLLNEIIKKEYKRNNIKQYQFITNRDDRTCKECSALDGLVFDIKHAEIGINYPPIHTNCRCITIPYIQKAK